MKKKIKVVAHYKKSKIKTQEFIGTKWTRSENDGGLYFLKEGSANLPIQFWARQNNREVKTLIECSRIKTIHSTDDACGRGAVNYVAPLYSEVISQIPKDLIAKTKAFEVCVENHLRNGDYDEIITILYN